jgi:hypothetical protein
MGISFLLTVGAIGRVMPKRNRNGARDGLTRLTECVTLAKIRSGQALPLQYSAVN